jgi:hypothetical protein
LDSTDSFEFVILLRCSCFLREYVAQAVATSHQLDPRQGGRHHRAESGWREETCGEHEKKKRKNKKGKERKDESTHMLA